MKVLKIYKPSKIDNKQPKVKKRKIVQQIYKRDAIVKHINRYHTFSAHLVPQTLKSECGIYTVHFPNHLPFTDYNDAVRMYIEIGGFSWLPLLFPLFYLLWFLWLFIYIYYNRR